MMIWQIDMNNFPPNISAKLEFSNHKKLFGLAEDHRIQYMTLNGAAFDELKPAIDWFVTQKRYSDAIHWLYKESPDCLERSLCISYLIGLEEKNVK